jgi:hypothetical protein
MHRGDLPAVRRQLVSAQRLRAVLVGVYLVIVGISQL